MRGCCPVVRGLGSNSCNFQECLVSLLPFPAPPRFCDGSGNSESYLDLGCAKNYAETNKINMWIKT